MGTYRIIKFYQHPAKENRVVARGYDLEGAQKFCSDPESSSMTAQPPKGCGGNEEKIKIWHEKQKHWFYGYTKE